MAFSRWRYAAAPVAAVLLLALAGMPAAAQGTITGKVTAVGSNMPLNGANVLVIGANQVATAGEDGKYTLRNVGVGNVDVQVLHVGYRSLKKRAAVTQGGTVIVDFQLEAATVQLQDVVITATGQQRRVELGNAVSTLGDVNKKVEQTPINSFSDLITAKAPGVIVLPGVMTGGAPTVRIRGLSSISLSNNPIYVVDGIRYDASTVSGGNSSFSMLSALSPEEIEDVEIVKGPSAATLYGTNASNGVVVITTRKGRAGTTKWTWIGELGSVQDRNPYQDMYANWGHTAGNPGTQIRCVLKNQGPGAVSPCISDSLTHYNLMEDKSRTFVHDEPRSLLGLNVSGGTEAVRFFVSGEMDNELGPVQMPGFEVTRFETAKIAVQEQWMHPIAQAKLNFRANVNAALSPKMDIGASMGFATQNNRFPPSGAAFEALYYVGMMNYGFKGPGLDKVTTDVLGTPLNDYLQYAPGDIMQRYRPSYAQRTTMSFNMNYRPLSWIQTDGTVGFDLIDRDNSDLCALNTCAPTGTTRQGLAADTKTNIRNISLKLSGTATWNATSWANLKSTLGADYVNSESEFSTASGTVLPPGATQVQDATTRTGSVQYPTATKTLGFYIQEQAGLRDRMFVTLAVRSDQNSAFGTQFQSVVYPKASVSWIASDESFFPRYNWLNQFRLRASYGAAGVQPGRTDALVTFSAGSQNIANRNSLTGTDVPGLAASTTGNAFLKPETSGEMELGFDAQLFNNRLRAEYTYYDKQSKDALIQVAIAPSSAAAQLNPLINVGKTRNWGHELTLNAQVIEMRNLGWDITVNASHNSNNVVSLGIDPTSGQPRVIGAGGRVRQVVGYPINGEWIRPYKFNDANGDHILQVNEVTVDTGFVFNGYQFPRDVVSITHGLDLLDHKLRLNLGFDYKGGWNLQDGGNNFQCNAAPFACRETNDPTTPLEWQARAIAKQNGTTFVCSCPANGTSFKTDAGYRKSGQFWKWRELSASYLLPTSLLKYAKAANGSNIVAGMRNVHTWTQYTGLDPEEHDQPSDTQSNFQSAGPNTYFTLRLNLKY